MTHKSNFKSWLSQGDADEYARRETCAERVNALKQILNEISEG